MADTGNGSRQDWVDRRAGKYMAQTLEEFERLIEPLIPKDQAHDFKGTVRRKFNAYAADMKELIELEDRATKNELAQEIVERIFPDGVPTSLTGKVST